MLVKPPVQFTDRYEPHPPEPQQPNCRLHMTLERVQRHPARARGLLARQRKPGHRTGDNLTARRVRIAADAHGHSRPYDPLEAALAVCERHGRLDDAEAHLAMCERTRGSART